MEILEVCGLKAAEGEKVSAMVDVPGTAGSQIPVTIINGAKEGKTVLITGGLHSCEYVGPRRPSNWPGRFSPVSSPAR